MVYFILVFIFIFSLFTTAAVSQEEKEVLLKETILTTGEELKLPVDCDAFIQVDIHAKNMVEESSVFWRTSFLKGEEKSVSEIESLESRTYNLPPKSSVNSDVKISFECSGLDEVMVHVKKGKVQFEIIGKTEY